jgi:hypothetical protein
VVDVLAALPIDVISVKNYYHAALRVNRILKIVHFPVVGEKKKK